MYVVWGFLLVMDGDSMWLILSMGWSWIGRSIFMCNWKLVLCLFWDKTGTELIVNGLFVICLLWISRIKLLLSLSSERLLPAWFMCMCGFSCNSFWLGCLWIQSLGWSSLQSCSWEKSNAWVISFWISIRGGYSGSLFYKICFFYARQGVCKTVQLHYHRIVSVTWQT